MYAYLSAKIMCVTGRAKNLLNQFHSRKHWDILFHSADFEGGFDVMRALEINRPYLASEDSCSAGKGVGE